MLPNKPTFTLPAHLVLFILLLYSFAFSCQQACNHQDQSSLLAFWANISTSPSFVPLNWSSPTSCCQWEGVICDINGRVTHLQLPARGLKGVLFTSSISSLAMLTHLNLSNNNLHGSLGQDISMLTNLRILDLSLNNIVGSIPQEIGKLLFLEKLHLYENNVSGPIPSSLMNCSHLVEIILRDNFLRDDISKLDFSKLVRLQKLDFKNNSLNGTLPESIYSCKSLIAIRVAQNFITGQISPKFVELKSLSFISLGFNSLTNITATLKILAKCKNLSTLILSFNFYGESLPVHVNFIGLGEFPKIQYLNLRYCNFAPGPIPNWLSTLRTLRVLDLFDTRLVGRVPNWLGTLPNLSSLSLGKNSLLGEFPLHLCQLPALISQKVQADNPKFNEFELPVFGAKSNSYIKFKIGIGSRLDLAHNAFSGNIPKEIGNLHNLQGLYLHDNQFSGHIPISIADLKKLEYLALSKNNLTGEIPTSLASLSFLSHFNVSYNDLEGPIPTGGQFLTFDQSSFEGNNLGLCGEPLNHPCSNPATSKTKEINGSHDNKQPFLNGLYVGLATGFSSILIVVMSYVWFN